MGIQFGAKFFGTSKRPAAIPYGNGAHRVKRSKATDDESDSDLLRLSAKGDEEAFLILYRRHQGPVFRFALHMSGSPEIAEEVTQEVFLAMLTTRQYAAAQGSLQGYLIGIARNHVRRLLRAAREVAMENSLGGEPRNDSGDDLLHALSRNQELRALRNAILSLPANYREVVVLCDVEGMDYVQTATQLGCAVGTVRSRLHRGRAILEAKLSGKRQRGRERCPA